MKEYWFSPLNEWKHYLGWFLTASLISLNISFFYSQINFTNYIKFLVPIIIPLIVMDFINHKVMLQ